MKSYCHILGLLAALNFACSSNSDNTQPTTTPTEPLQADTFTVKTDSTFVKDSVPTATDSLTLFKLVEFDRYLKDSISSLPLIDFKKLKEVHDINHLIENSPELVFPADELGDLILAMVYDNEGIKNKSLICTWGTFNFRAFPDWNYRKREHPLVGLWSSHIAFHIDSTKILSVHLNDSHGEWQDYMYCSWENVNDSLHLRYMEPRSFPLGLYPSYQCRFISRPDSNTVLLQQNTGYGEGDSYEISTKIEFTWPDQFNILSEDTVIYHNQFHGDEY